MTITKTSLYASLFLSLIAYVLLGYVTERSDFNQLISVYGLAFIFYGASFFLIKRTNAFLIPLLAAIIFRLSLLFYIPNLSDDFYRFIWDGRLSMQGINVFQFLPSELIEQSKIAVDAELFKKLNSQNYYTVYPPVSQFIFFLSAILFPTSVLGSVVILKSVIVLFEMGSIYFLYKLLTHFNLRRELLFLYALNPLVIVELSGNIHFEAGMTFFTLLAVYFAINNKTLLSGIALAFAAATKLWPLIFLPFFLRRLSLKNGLLMAISSSTILILLFLPFWTSGFVSNFASSISLYFKHFEFNGSLYYLIKKLNYAFTDQNPVEIKGLWLPVSALITIGLIFLFEQSRKWKTLFRALLFTLSTYFLFATTVHPWYITPLVAFSIFTPFRYPIIWSVLIPITYITYSQLPYEENELVILIEYLILGAFLIYEIAEVLRLEFKSAVS